MRIALLLFGLVAASFAVAFAQSPAPGISASPAPAPNTPSSSAPQVVASPLPDLARTRVDAMLRSGNVNPSAFSVTFLSQVTAAQVEAVLAQLGVVLGKYQSIDGSAGHYSAHFEKGTDDVLVHLDAGNKIDGLFFRPPKLLAATLDDSLRNLRASNGRLSYVIVEGSTERAALDPAAPLAVGSTFKLAVLAALRDEIAAGRRNWSDVVTLDPRWKSLPSGVMHTWPDGTPVTLATYAAEMISISDNTAADALASIVGTAALVPYEMGNTPFLTTREAFILKSTPHGAQGAAYLAAATLPQRAAILAAVDKAALPEAGELVAKPMLGIEWHYSVRALCALMAKVADLPLMSINPGAADTSSFERVAYKGGSDAGTINLTTQVTTLRGTHVCFSATLNDSANPLDDNAFTTAYGGVLSVLAKQ
jgi:beta-lactamase class A